MIHINLLWSVVGGQLAVAKGNQLDVIIDKRHLAVISGWWPMVHINLLWSVVGGQLAVVKGNQLDVISDKHHLAVTSGGQ